MLVLSRRIDERLIIKTDSGERIEVVVFKVRGNRVTIGIVAPLDTRVVRAELEEEDAA